MKRLLFAALLCISTGCFAECPADWFFSPPCIASPPDVPRSVPEPDSLALFAAAAVAGALVRRRRK